MKVTQFPKKLSRKYLRLAAVYRRFAERNRSFDFSLSALLECHAHESLGTPVDSKNGYVYGKRMKDITMAAWIEDIQKGHFVKGEFYTPLNYWFAEPALKNVIITPLFTSKQYYEATVQP